MEKLAKPQRLILQIGLVFLLLIIVRYVYMNKKQQRLEKEYRELYHKKQILKSKQSVQ